MSLPFEFLIGLRYTRSGRRTGRKDPVCFLHLSDVCRVNRARRDGADHCASVMNGFQTQVRDRMLSVIPHIQISSGTGPVSDWRSLGRGRGKELRSAGSRTLR